MRFKFPHTVLAVFTVIGTVNARPCLAQTHVTSIEDLRGTLDVGDLLTIVPADGRPLTGRLVRFDLADLDLRVGNTQTVRERRPRIVTMPFAAIQSLERRRDSVRNGVAIGAGIGAGFGGAMFVHAFVVDRNEMDEWAPSYVGGAAVSTGIGALIGWAVDAAKSKPHITFTARRQSNPRVRLRPVYGPRRSIAVAVSF